MQIWTHSGSLANLVLNQSCALFWDFSFLAENKNKMTLYFWDELDINCQPSLSLSQFVLSSTVFGTCNFFRQFIGFLLDLNKKAIFIPHVFLGKQCFFHSLLMTSNRYLSGSWFHWFKDQDEHSALVIKCRGQLEWINYI